LSPIPGARVGPSTLGPSKLMYRYDWLNIMKWKYIYLI